MDYRQYAEVNPLLTIWVFLLWLFGQNLQVILLIAPMNKLQLKHEEAEEYATLIMETLDIEHRGYIEVCHFNSTFLILS